VRHRSDRGPRAVAGGGRGGGGPSLGWACPSMRRRVAGGRAPLAGSQPQWRTCMQPCGKTGGRHRRRNSLTARGVVRRRTLPTCREVQVTVRSCRLTRRWWEMATLKPEGAREVQAAGPWCWACRWPCHGMVQTWGARCSSHPAWPISALPRAREMGERALTGTKTWALAGRQVVRALERPPPGTRSWLAPRASGPEAALRVGQPLAGRGRGLQQGLGSQAWRRAEHGTQGLRDRAGAEQGRPRELWVQRGLAPRWRFLRLALGPVPVATGTLDAGFCPTALARREAVAVMAAVARWDGPAGLTVSSGAGGRALQGLRGTSREASAESRHGRSPGLRALRRSYAAAGPVWVRWRESLGVARWGGPRERGMRRGCTPAASRGVAEACRRGGRATPVWVSPARCWAVRQAPWTLERRIGDAAVGPGG
jgi:hypothetical protein